MPDTKCTLDPQRSCPVMVTVQRLDKDVAELKGKMSQFEIAFAVREEQYKHILERLSEISTSMNSMSTKIENIESKPAKRWEELIKQVISLLVAAIVGAIIASIFGVK